MKHSIVRSGTIVLTTVTTALNLLGISPALAASLPNPAAPEPAITTATSSSSYGYTSPYFHDSGAQTALTMAQKLALLQSQVKYVFVLFQENRSFDHYFGTYPGANGLYGTFPGANASDPYAQPGNTVSSASSVIQNVDGTWATISPWLLPRTITDVNGATVQLYPESIYSVDHSHAGYINDLHADQATKSTTLNDGYPLDQEGLHYSTNASGLANTGTIVKSNGTAPTSGPTLQTKQKGEIVMAHVDCDTVPFLWQYADRFVLFDNFHQTAVGPSSPNAIAVLAGQMGDTQWVKHPSEADPTGLSLPNVTDTKPYPGSTNDAWTGKPPYGLDDGSLQNNVLVPTSTTQIPLTFASLPLSFMGSQIGNIIANDQNPGVDLIDTRHDVQAIAVKNPTVSWGWYEQGFGPEPFDGTDIYIDNDNFTSSGAPVHGSLVTHHVGPQFFGYLADNATVYQPQVGYATPNQPGNLHGLQQFYTDITSNALPAAGGVFYVRGGYYNNDGLTPADPNTTVEHTFPGNDDHGSYSDSQISEALVADSVNAIVDSKYWPNSVIIITYDETDGFYDHQAEAFRTYGPDGQPETAGPRIPAIVISPFAVTHGVSHVYSEHSAVISFINQLFGLTPLSSLPDEVSAQKSGANYCAAPPSGTPAGVTYCAPSGAAQTQLGPADTAAMGNLLEAFDNDRLLGNIAALPAAYAQIGSGIQAANTTTASLPHYGGAGCTTLNITPTDYSSSGYGAGLESDPPPLDFNPRPTVSTGSPYYETSGNTTACVITGGVVTNAAACEQGSGSPWGN
jgi:phospholipase C